MNTTDLVNKAKALPIVGQHVDAVINGNPVSGRVTAAKPSFTAIVQEDGSEWTGIKFRIKPDDGSRAIWTPTMPWEPVAA